MSDIERLRKLAGIKPKQILNESTKTEVKESTIYHVYRDKISGLEKKDPVSKEKLDSIFKRRALDRDGGMKDHDITPEEFYNQLSTKGFAKMGKIRFEQSDEVTESTTEYDLSISTDTFGQYKSKPLEPDFPADMGEKFSKFSSGESNDAIGDGQDGFGKEEGSEQPKETGSTQASEAKPAADPKDRFKPKASSEEPKAPAKDVSSDSKDESTESKPEPKVEKEPEESEKDDEFTKKVKEAQEYYRLKHFIRSNLRESQDYADAFMAAIKVLEEQAETLIVKFGANLTQNEEKNLAMDIAKDLTEGRKSVREAAQIHGARGSRKGSTYTFEFTDTASALMFTSYLAETCECVSVLRSNRGYIEAKVRDFAKDIK